MNIEIIKVIPRLIKKAGAETCSGPTYSFDPTCNSDCSVVFCQDISAETDGSLYQCCPTNGNAPEFPGWLNPFVLAIALTMVFWFFHRAKEENKAGKVQ